MLGFLLAQLQGWIVSQMYSIDNLLKLPNLIYLCLGLCLTSYLYCKRGGNFILLVYIFYICVLFYPFEANIKFYSLSSLFLTILSIKQQMICLHSLKLPYFLICFILHIRQMQDIQRKNVCLQLAKCLSSKSKKHPARYIQGHHYSKNKKNNSIEISKLIGEQSFHSVDKLKPLRKHHTKTSKNSKQAFDINNLYYFQIPNAGKSKRRGSYKLSKNQIQKSPLYSLLQSTSQYYPGALTNGKKGSSFLSTSCSRKEVIKKQPKCQKQQDLASMMVRSTLLLQRYRTRCVGLEKENSQLKRKYSFLQKKVRTLKKNKFTVDLINVF